MDKAIVLLTVSALAAGCSSMQDREATQQLASSKVKTNAELAVQQCGKGKVKRVTSKNFSCKN